MFSLQKHLKRLQEQPGPIDVDLSQEKVAEASTDTDAQFQRLFAPVQDEYEDGIFVDGVFVRLDQLRSLTFKDVQPLLEALKTNKKVCTLNLKSVVLKDDAVPYLVDLLSHNVTIVELDLTSTDISLPNIKHLQELCLYHHPYINLKHESIVIEPLLDTRLDPLMYRLQALFDNLRPPIDREIVFREKLVTLQHCLTELAALLPQAHAVEEHRRKSIERKLYQLLDNIKICKESLAQKPSSDTGGAVAAAAHETAQKELIRRLQADLLTNLNKARQFLAAVIDSKGGREEKEAFKELASEAIHQRSSLDLEERMQELQLSKLSSLSEIQQLRTQLQEQIQAQHKEDEAKRIELEARLLTAQEKLGQSIMENLNRNIEIKFSQLMQTTAKQLEELQHKQAALIADAKREAEELERQVKELRCQSQDMEKTNPRYSELQSRIEKLQIQQRDLEREAEAKRQWLAGQEYLCQDHELCLFYRRIQSKLTEIFLALKVLASGMVDIPPTVCQQMIQKGISLAGAVIPLPGATMIAEGLSWAVGFGFDKAAKKRVEQQSAFIPTLPEIEAIVEGAARKLSFRYEDQLHQLTSEGVVLLGECAVARIVSYLDSGTQRLPEGAIPSQLILCVVDQLVDAVFNTKPAGKLAKLFSKNISIKIAQEDRSWVAEAIFMQPGIRTPKEAKSDESEEYLYFSGEAKVKISPLSDETYAIVTHPEKYGYRFAIDDIEARNLGLQPQAAVVPQGFLPAKKGRKFSPRFFDTRVTLPKDSVREEEKESEALDLKQMQIQLKSQERRLMRLEETGLAQSPRLHKGQAMRCMLS